MPPPKGNHNQPEEDVSGLTLPPVVDAVLNFFEGFSGKPRVTFHYVEVSQKHPCSFCGDPTPHRLQVNREGEQAVS